MLQTCEGLLPGELGPGSRPSHVPGTDLRVNPSQDTSRVYKSSVKPWDAPPGESKLMWRPWQLVCSWFALI